MENVSAYICPKCGARSIPGKLAVSTGKTIDGLFQSAKETETEVDKELFPAFSGISFHRINL